MDKFIKALKSKYVVSIMLALAIGMILHHSINAFKKYTEPQYTVDVTFHSATRFLYLDEKDTLELASCATGINVRMQYNRDTLIFSGEGSQMGYKPIAFADSSTMVAQDERGVSFYFRRIKRDGDNEALWFATGHVLNVLTTEKDCFEFKE